MFDRYKDERDKNEDKLLYIVCTSNCSCNCDSSGWKPSQNSIQNSNQNDQNRNHNPNCKPITNFNCKLKSAIQIKIKN